MNMPEVLVGDMNEVYQTVHCLGIHCKTLLLMKPITCHMDFASEQTELIHPLVEAHLVDARAQGE